MQFDLDNPKNGSQYQLYKMRLAVEQLAGEIVAAVTAAVNVPVTVKIRKGWNDTSVNAVEMAKIAEANGAAAVTVHGRTREQFYSGTADLEIIKAVKAAVSIPVIGNGDITDGESAKRMLDYTGCDGIMIGRGAQGNPWVFRQVIHYLKIGEALPPPTPEERAEKMTEHPQNEDFAASVKEMRAIANKGYGNFLNPAATFLSGLGALRDGNYDNARIEFKRLYEAMPKIP